MLNCLYPWLWWLGHLAGCSFGAVTALVPLSWLSGAPAVAVPLLTGIAPIGLAYMALAHPVPSPISGLHLSGLSL